MKDRAACYVCGGTGYDPQSQSGRCEHPPGPIEEAILITKLADVKRRQDDESRRQHPSQEYPESHG